MPKSTPAFRNSTSCPAIRGQSAPVISLQHTAAKRRPQGLGRTARSELLLPLGQFALPAPGGTSRRPGARRQRW